VKEDRIGRLLFVWRNVGHAGKSEAAAELGDSFEVGRTGWGTDSAPFRTPEGKGLFEADDGEGCIGTRCRSAP